jgi:4-diphosphocytidyl-2C-methyl-D-erythritol kinase
MVVSTQAAYGVLRQANAYQTLDVDSVLNQLSPSTDLEQIQRLVHNDFEQMFHHAEAELGHVFGQIQDLGWGRPLLCGSGAAMALFAEPSESRRALIAQRFPGYDYQVWWTSTLAISPYTKE